MADRRFIEESFPVKEISALSAKEKSIRHGHISTLHIWWARRPLASSRATNYLSLIPAPENETEKQKTKKFIENFSIWKNSLNISMIEEARENILTFYNGKKPRILDPFAGGGAIPLEALRLGCEVYAGDYNPVATLLLKCTLEFPQKYRDTSSDQWKSVKSKSTNRLYADVKKWGMWVLEETKKEIGKFYPEEDGFIPVGYIWARTIPCQNPSCKTEIPLMRQYWLAKKKNKKISLKPFIRNGKTQFEIINNPDFNPSKGTVSRAIVKCPVCGSIIDASTTRKLFHEGKAGQRLIAIVLRNPNEQGKIYRIAADEDLKIYKEAELYLEEKRTELKRKWGFDFVPDEETPEGKGRGAERAFSIRNFGMNKWSNLFNSRQKLALITFMDKVRDAYSNMIDDGYGDDYTKVIMTYLALIIDRLADKNSNLVVYNVVGEKIEHVFGRQALPITWDYTELNIFSGANGDWKSNLKWILRVIDHLLNIPTFTNKEPIINQFSATSLPFPENYFDAVFTDPPYYDNVPYSYLSDFFYVWLKRCIGHLYPDLFSIPLTPKSKEIVAYTHDKSWEEGKQFFEDMLKKSFQEINRVLKPNGIATIVYAHKTTEGWETVINALLDSNLVITASWPINTEMQARLRAKESAALASSIYIVARKMEREEIGWFNEVKVEIKKYLSEKMGRLWKERISGADYFIAAIGSSIEIFGKYKKIKDYEGNEIRAKKLIDFVRNEVTNYAVKQILHNGIAEKLTALTKFYLLWRWTFQEKKVVFDEARKIAQSTGIDLSKEWNKGFIRKKGEFISILGPHERDIEKLEDSKELIDILHYSLLLWKEGNREKMKEILQNSEFGIKDYFYRTAQAISETLPSQSAEKKLLEGFLSGKERLIKEVKVKSVQKRLFE